MTVKKLICSEQTKKRRGNSQIWEVWRRFKKNKIAMAGLIIFLIFMYGRHLCRCYYTIFCSDYADKGCIAAKTQYGTPFWYGQPGKRYVCPCDTWFAVFNLAGNCHQFSIPAYQQYSGGYFWILRRDIGQYHYAFAGCPHVYPSLMLALCIVAALGANLVNLLIAMTIGQIPGTVRLVRSAIMSVSGADYIEAARCHGASDLRIIVKYIIPNALGPIIVDTTVNASRFDHYMCIHELLRIGYSAPGTRVGQSFGGCPRVYADCSVAVVYPRHCFGDYCAVYQSDR